MMEPDQSPYDELPYVGHAYPDSHPGRLAVLAKLFGMQPPPLNGCRVLELGCASGGNLLPMAAQMPGSSFLGIDLSSRQIADAQAVASELGLRNIEFRQLSIAHVDASMGRFDYIIAHGVYSWVPPEIREKLLSICAENLAPNGVAYISYNTYPGWHMRGMVRNMMLYHVRQFREASLQVAQARVLLDFLEQNLATDNSPYGLLLKQERDLLRDKHDSYLAHDHLEQDNEPVYFHQFAEQAARHRLQYLAEAEFSSMVASNISPQTPETLRAIAPDVIRMEQYMDFLRNRTFRRSLLVHHGVPLNRNLDWRNMDGFYVASAARPVSPTPDVRSTAAEQFRAPGGATVSIQIPIVKAAMMILVECWPQDMHFIELCVAARARLGTDPLSAQNPGTTGGDEEDLGIGLLQCYAAAMVELRMDAAPLSKEVGNLPKASALARFQAGKGPVVTNLRHENISLDEFNRQLLRCLDGRHDRSELLEILEGLVSSRILKIQYEGNVVSEGAIARRLLKEALDENLPKLAQFSLLEG